MTTHLQRSPMGRLFLFFAFGILLSTSVWAQLPTASQVASQMKVGWNLGNTLEAICGETAWGNPTATQTLINAVKAAGFNTVRIPCAWDCHTSNGVIDAAWIARVKQVVDYCISANLYVILNIHWDNGWLENNVTTAAQASVNAKQKNYWTQIANYFKSYNEHLLFAGANEPNVTDATGMSVLLSYHQTFINAVRATGGNNSSRTLIIQGPGTDIEKTNSLMNTMPTDQIASHLMVEVHYYTPYQYCLMTADASWGNMFYYWGSGYHSTTDASRNATWGEEADVEKYFGMMKTKFVDKGIPVIIGEFGAMKRSNLSDMSVHLASRQYFYKYVVSSAVSKGMIPFCWDAGAPYSTNTTGLFDRSTGAIADQGVVNAIMTGAGGGGSTTTYVTIKNRSTGLLFDGMGRTSSGSACGQYSSGSSTNQQWIIESAGSYVKIKNRTTGLYLDGGGLTANGSVVSQYSSSSSNNQQWTQVTSGSYMKFKNRATGLYIDGMGRTSNGSDLGQYSSSNSNNQQWTITNVKSAPYRIEKTESDDVTIFPNPASNGSIKIDLSGMAGSTNINLIDVNGKILQKKIFTDQSLVQMDLTVSPGIYFLQIISGEKNIVKRMIVEK